jgi:hypothetical protein
VSHAFVPDEQHCFSEYLIFSDVIFLSKKNLTNLLQYFFVTMPEAFCSDQISPGVLYQAAPLESDFFLAINGYILAVLSLLVLPPPVLLFSLVSW